MSVAGLLTNVLNPLALTMATMSAIPSTMQHQAARNVPLRTSVTGTELLQQMMQAAPAPAQLVSPVHTVQSVLQDMKAIQPAKEVAPASWIAMVMALPVECTG